MNQRISTPGKKTFASGPVDSSSSMNNLKSHGLRSPDTDTMPLNCQKYDGRSSYLDELQEIHQLCVHNAEICKNCDEVEKQNVWKLLAETAMPQMNERGRDFNGWGGKGGGAPRSP